jgi:tetratricopeptide (TPR) repeat protein
MLTQARYLYLPMACWAPAAAWALHLRLTTRATAAVHAALVLAVLLSAVGLHANLPPWSSDLALWTRATQVRPDSGRAWFNLGTVHENAGRLADAETCYTRAVQAEPERAIFHFRRAFMLAERSALDDARREFRRAAELRPGDPMFLYEAGRIEGAVGDPREAARLLDEAAAALARGVRPGGGVSAEKIQAEREALGRRSGTSR